MPRMPAGGRAAELVRVKGLPDNPATWSAPLKRRGWTNFGKLMTPQTQLGFRYIAGVVLSAVKKGCGQYSRHCLPILVSFYNVPDVSVTS